MYFSLKLYVCKVYNSKCFEPKKNENKELKEVLYSFRMCL